MNWQKSKFDELLKPSLWNFAKVERIFFDAKCLFADEAFTTICSSKSLGLTLTKLTFYGRCTCLLFYFINPPQEIDVRI